MPLKKIPEIAKEYLENPNGDVFFFDEGRFGTMPVVRRLWARVGERAHSYVKPGYKNFYAYSSVSPITGEAFSLLLPWVNSEMMTLYLSELSRTYSGKNLLLIMDCAGWHKAKELKIPPNIKIEYLPPYSPELNPVERLWQWLRRHICSVRLFESEDELMAILAKKIYSLSDKFFMSLCSCSYMHNYK